MTACSTKCIHWRQNVPSGRVDQHDRRRGGLAGVEQRQDLEGLVHRAEAAGEDGERVRGSRHGDLAREEVLHRHEHRLGVDVGVGELLEGQFDVDAERVLAAGALGRGLHDPGSGAGDDHPAALGHRRAEFARHLVERRWRLSVRAEPKIASLGTSRHWARTASTPRSAR